ncbi:MAG: TonB-dependent receptor [Phycisphaerae bacterium]|nr:TonB-dependent receptor [Saprospiraceae bacterium]
MKRLFTLLVAIVITAAALLAQSSTTQTISGQVLDKDSQEPLIGASVRVENAEPAIGAVTDLEGKFSLKNVPLGRWQVQCSYVGYEPWLSDPLIINSARETFLNIVLSEGAANQMQEVVVTARKRGNEPINDLSMLSTRSFSVDETQRYAASANDPSRMAMGFPGVQPSRDSRSDIVVRGNSGIGLLWRLEGIDIPNPNHFARRGSSGGGITIFSVSMLANSDFSTGAFPAEYGNAYSGAFDVHFRKGNPDKREYTFRAGMLGLDFSTEGPFGKKSESSYLVNYRYSTLGILNKLGLHLVGERIDNTFQDLSFNLNFPSKNKKHVFTFWGIGGLSQETENAVENTSDWKSFTDYYTRDFDTNMGALGGTHTALLKGDAFIKTSVAAMGQTIDWRNDTLNMQRIPYNVNIEQYREGRYVVASLLNKKFNRRVSLKTGFFVNLMPYYFYRNTLGDSTGLEFEGITAQIQPYANLRFRPSEKWTFNAGLHFLYFDLNESTSIEPRLAAKYQISEKQSLSLAWGIHGRVLPLGNYFTRVNGRLVNHNVDLIRAQHTVLGWDFLAGKSMRLHAEVYFQKMKDVPVAKNPASSWSILNTISGFATQEMVNEGEGENLGLDLSVEKSFAGGTFFLLSGSVSQSRYTDVAGREHPTAFDSGLSGSLMAGKEWSFKNASVLQLGLKLLYNGGQRLTPLLPGQTVSRFSQEPLLDEANAFSEQVEAYFRPDMRIAFRKNNPKTAWTLALDIQNVLGQKNIDPLSREYDPDMNKWVYREQSGLTPVLSFQIDL